EAYWTTTAYIKTEPPVIKRPIGRPKVHSRKRDLVEVLIEGDKLKKSFKVTCSKCGEKGHNYKTCKGAPANPAPKTNSRKKRRGESSTQDACDVQVSQSAPQPEGEDGGVDSQQGNSAAQVQVEVPIAEGPSKRFRAKQPVRPRLTKKLLP
ncbi:hypothetical protein PIB30_109417, partial [Stylosanthes scabra]|nr:hypothetical protein [Stylosanthes scabra]